MKPYEGKDIEGFIAALDEEDNAIARELRKVIHEAIPDVREIFK